MRIGIDISPIIYGTGVSTYTKNLVKGLVQYCKKDQLVLFGGSLRRRGELVSFANALGNGVEKKFYYLPPTLADYLWNRKHVVNIETLTGDLDIFHSSDWAQPPTRAFSVTTMHDMSPFTHPESMHPKIVSAHKARLKWVIKEVDYAIVPSKVTASVLSKMGYPSNKIRVIYEAPDPLIKKKSPKIVKRVKDKYQIDKYLLSVGVGSRKNTDRTISAYNSLNNDKLQLVIVGKKWGDYKDNKKVLFLGHIDINDLSALYSGAEALLYPSLDEGFGLPILEAFVCECPVITSNISSMPEVAGDAALLVNPLKVEDIASGIKEALKQRDELIKKGKERLKLFSWEKTAKETYKIYEESIK